MKISDRAIAERGEDVLGRWGLAKTIYDLIASSQTDGALRIGVYGGWGEGKTSVLRFVETLAIKEDIPVCWFSVWSAQTQPDLWAGLFDALQSIQPKTDRWAQLKKFTSKAAATAEPLAAVHPYTKAAHALAKLARLGREDAERVIARLRERGRVIILVDDVDRVDSALIPKLLMGLHDLFDGLDRCAFVVALDPVIISGGLSQLNPAWSSAPAFLEKIVQYPFQLPRPTEEQMHRLIVGTLRESRLDVPQQAVLDLQDLLPPNPRKVKQFVRSLQRLQTTLARHGEDEWNPTLLLLMELLRAASAEVAKALLEDRQFVEELVLGMFLTDKKDMHEGGRITKVQHERIQRAVENAMPLASSQERTRLVLQIAEIASAAADRLSLVSADDAMRHARLDHEPPVMTLREFDKIIAEWRDDSSAVNLTALLSKHASSLELTESEVLEGAALALLKRRDELIENASNAFESAEAQQLIQRVEVHSLLLDRLIADHNVLRDERIAARVAIFLAMRTQTAKFTNFLDDAIYAPVRDALRDQLYRAAEHLRDRAADVLEELKPWESSRGGPAVAGAEELRKTRERLHEIVSVFLCDSALERFKRPGDIAALGNFLKNRAEVWLMFSVGTAFHKPDCRARLLSIAEQHDEVVAQNFFVYLKMLVGDRGLVESPLRSEAGLVVSAWRAASRVRPQPKMKGEVIELVGRLRAALKDDTLIKLPAWVESGENEITESSSSTGTVSGVVDAAPDTTSRGD